MKTPHGMTMLAGVALLALTAGTARAEEIARVTVPFPFEANGEMLPSGQYDVRTDEQGSGIVMIEGIAATKAHAMLATIPDYRRTPGTKPALTFVRDGDHYRLSSVWAAGDYGRDVVFNR